MSTYFTSDTHFGHKFMADLREIGRDKLTEHDELIIENWNDTVGPRDEVWHLGDFTFHSDLSVVDKIFSRLNGIKHFVVGNHDSNYVQRQLAWESVHNLVQRRFEGHKIVLCHYPLLTWQNAHKGVYHLHGHCHGNLQAPESTRLDVGVDCHPEMRPFSLEEVLEILSEREYDFVDHHDGGTGYKERNQNR